MGHLRSARVYVENMDYWEFIPRFDRPESFFYLDPPYYCFKGCYGDGVFWREDFQNLRDLLDLANDDLGSAGLNIEPSVIVDRIISPLKDLYVKNLAGLLESFLRKNS
jgi:site-specific DNA-adenine methylase